MAKQKKIQPKPKKPAQEVLTLHGENRSVFGKKLRKLRKEGLIPANIYGPDFKSTAISVIFKEFVRVYKIARETGVIQIVLDKKELPVLIKQMQKHPVENIILHVDFRKIDLTQKLETNVPIRVIGQSEAVNQKNGVLLTLTENLKIEALPQDIPQSIEIDISSLREIGQETKVADLPKSSLYQIKDPLEKVIVSVVLHKEESITPETTAPVTEVITEEKVEETAETPAPEEKPPAKSKPETPTS